MNRFQRFALVLLVGAGLFFSACGAKQGGKQALRAEWNDIYGAAPADAAWVVGGRLDAEGLPRIMSMLLSSGPTGSSTGILGILQSHEQLANAEVAVFARDGAVWQVVRLEDVPGAMETLATHFNVVGEVEESRVRDRVVLRAKVRRTGGQEAGIEITHFDGYIVARASAPTDDETIRREFVAMARGWPTTGTYANVGHGAAQRARVAGSKIDLWAGVDFTTLATHLRIEAEQLGNEGEVSERCIDANARIATVVPSFALVSAENADGQKSVDGFLQLSARGVDRGRAMMAGAPSMDDFLGKALVGFGLSFDYNEFLRGLHATPDLESCYGIAGLAGMIAGLYGDYRNEVTFNARTISGTGAVVVQSVNFEGFVPSGEFGIVVGSDNAMALMNRITRFGSANGNVDTIADASSPAVRVVLPMMMLSLRLQVGDGRLVIGTSGLRDDVWSKLMSVPFGEAGAPGLDGFIDGVGLTAALERARSYVVDMFGEESEYMEIVDTLDTQTPTSRSFMRFEEGGLRILNASE